MLTAEENDLLCRVEAGAPMGQLMRRHWIPACLSEEVTEPDGAPVRTRLLGEDLVVFRDTDGRLGVLDEYCPHRRVSLALGRNEECAESICPSRICAQLQAMLIFTMLTRVSSVGAKAGGSNSGMLSAGPI